MPDPFGPEFWPVTRELGFLEVSGKEAAEGFVGWQHDIQAERGVELQIRELTHPLPELLGRLWPLTTIETRRYLFVPCGERWTACFENNASGGDPASMVSYLAEALGCAGVRASHVPHTIDREPTTGTYGATIFELYASEPTEFLNTERSIYAAHNGSNWDFGATGTVQSFEQENQYKKRSIAERFPLELLDQYLNALGIDAFNPAFYCPEPNAPAYMVEKSGPTAEGLRYIEFNERVT